MPRDSDSGGLGMGVFVCGVCVGDGGHFNNSLVIDS